MYTGRKVKFRKPILYLDPNTFETITVNGGYIFHEYIYSDPWSEYSCVLVTNEEHGGIYTFKVNNWNNVFVEDYLDFTKITEEICNLEF